MAALALSPLPSLLLSLSPTSSSPLFPPCPFPFLPPILPSLPTCSLGPSSFSSHRCTDRRAQGGSSRNFPCMAVISARALVSYLSAHAPSTTSSNTSLGKSWMACSRSRMRLEETGGVSGWLRSLPSYFAYPLASPMSTDAWIMREKPCCSGSTALPALESVGRPRTAPAC